MAAPSDGRDGGSRHAGQRGGSAHRANHGPASRGPHDWQRRGSRDAEAPAYRLAATDGAPGRARQVVAGRLRDELEGQRLQDALLLVSELVTNSVVHADLGQDGWIALTVRLDDQAVHVEVEDSGTGFGERGHELPPPDRPCGRGLFLLHALSDRCGVAPAGSSRVWFELDR
jgi:anti-sigma regulatory factor (Ser/Thr protein kinase)